MAGNLHTLLRDLQRRKARERRGLVVAEGRRLVEDALDAGAKVAALLVADDVQAQTAGLLEEAVRRGIEAEIAPRKDFDVLADTETPSGVLAVVEWKPLALEGKDGSFLGEVEKPKSGHVALFGELQYQFGPLEYTLSTQLRSE